MSESTDRYRVAPEWAPHQATWLSWPHNRLTWPGCLAEAEAALSQAVVALAEEKPFTSTCSMPASRRGRGPVREDGGA